MFRRQIAAAKLLVKSGDLIMFLCLIYRIQCKTFLRNKSIHFIFIFMDPSNAKCQDEDFFIVGAIEMHINLVLEDPQLFMLSIVFPKRNRLSSSKTMIFEKSFQKLRTRFGSSSSRNDFLPSHWIADRKLIFPLSAEIVKQAMPICKEKRSRWN